MQKLLFVASLALASVAAAQQPIALPAFGNTFSGSLTRGFWFTCPANCIVQGVAVPNEAAQPFQTVEIIDLGTTPPPAYPTTVTGTQLLYDNTTAAGSVIPTNLVLQPGNVYGVLGCCNNTQGGGTAYNSYGTPTGAFTSSILGNPVALTRFGTQSNIAANGGNQPVWTEPSGAIARVELYIVPAAGLYPGFSSDVQSGPSPLTVNFTDTSYSSDPSGILAWAWDFGDGNSSSAQHPTHTYTACGTFTVSLSVFDASHPPATETKLDLISIDPMIVDFTATPTSGYVPLIVNFTDASTGNPTSWAWDFDNDGTVDSTIQNPVWAYAAAGSYTVSLTASNGCGSATETKVNYIATGQQGARPLQPEILQLQFNEFRGDQVANTGTATPAAPSLNVVPTGWQGDTARNRFRGNDAGFGCLDGPSAIDTGWGPNITGSFSIGYWIRLDQGVTTPPTGTHYVFSNGIFRAFTGGVANASIWFRGTSLGDFDALYNIGSAPNGQWVHMLLVVDDAAGMATWYVDGQASNTLAFTPNSFSYVSATTLKVGASTATGGSSVGASFAIDDFRMYSRPLQAFDAQALFFEYEHATTGSFGTSCPTTAGDIDIAGTGGFPTVGNATFGVNASNLEAGQLTALILGVFPANAPVLNLDPWLVGPGCELQIDNLGLLIGVPSATGTFMLPIPIPTGLAPTHMYAQAVQYGSAGGGVSKILDINIQD